MPIRPDEVRIIMVAAAASDGGIGFKGGLLFKLKEDMAHFRAVTAGKPVVMGRKTWESLPKRPLPGRPNIVVTRQTDFSAQGVFVYADLAAALGAARAMAARMGVSEAAVVGGAEIYRAALPATDVLWLTDVEAEVEADTFFPEFEPSQWREASTRRVEKGEGNDAAYVIRELVRVR